MSHAAKNNSIRRAMAGGNMNSMRGSKTERHKSSENPDLSPASYNHHQPEIPGTHLNSYAGSAGTPGSGHGSYSFESSISAKDQEELRLRELDEARARAMQMEKTMRWWSDCTANWREKWSKVRTERNKARDELKQTRAKLEVSFKECNQLKRDCHDMSLELEKFKRDHDRTDRSTLSPVNLLNGSLIMSPDSSSQLTAAGDGFKVSQSKSLAQDLEYFEQLLHGDHSSLDLQSTVGSCGGARRKEPSVRSGSSASSTHSNRGNGPINDALSESIEYKNSVLLRRLDDAGRTINASKEENNSLKQQLEKAVNELQQLRVASGKEDPANSKEAVEVLNGQTDKITANSQSDGTTVDQHLNDVRTQLEKLQQENASEWNRREQAETEKIALDREIKKLRAHCADLEERLDRKSKQIITATDAGAQITQIELQAKVTELTDLKKAHSKLRKILSDKVTELAHATRRAEQYEQEVRRLRIRVDELKKEMANAEDEIDTATNNIRRLQRTNDELQQQGDSLQVQVDHLQTRLRNATVSSTSRHSLDRRISGHSGRHEPDLSDDDYEVNGVVEFNA